MLSSCRYIRDFFGFDCPKEGCGVRAPIVFAYYTMEERVQKLLEEELTVDEALEKIIAVNPKLLEKYPGLQREYELDGTKKEKINHHL